MTSMSRLQFLSMACGQHENVLMKIFGPPSSHPTHAFHVISMHKFSLFMPPLLIDTTTGLAIKHSKTGASSRSTAQGVLYLTFRDLIVFTTGILVGVTLVLGFLLIHANRGT